MRRSSPDAQTRASRAAGWQPKHDEPLPPIPRDPLPDSTLAFLRDGYEFIPKRAHRLGTDMFRTRLLLRKAICLTGHEAAELFYDTSRFRREGAAPGRLPPSRGGG